MRRQDREITELDELLEIINRCDICRLALNDDGYPYILPLNFGTEVNDGKLTLYFHSALEGYKVGLFEKDNRATFEMDCKHELEYFEDKGYCTMSYESVIGRGRIEILPEEEKQEALERLMAHYHPGENAPFNPAAIPRTLVYALIIEKMTGKRKSIKKF